MSCETFSCIKGSCFVEANSKFLFVWQILEDLGLRLPWISAGVHFHPAGSTKIAAGRISCAWYRISSRSCYICGFFIRVGIVLRFAFVQRSSPIRLIEELQLRQGDSHRSRTKSGLREASRRGHSRLFSPGNFRWTNITEKSAVSIVSHPQGVCFQNVKVVCADIRAESDLVNQADLIVMNNVFSFFLDPEEQVQNTRGVCRAIHFSLPESRARLNL